MTLHNSYAKLSFACVVQALIKKCVQAIYANPTRETSKDDKELDNATRPNSAGGCASFVAFYTVLRSP